MHHSVVVKISGIYLITNLTNGKVYVGMSSNTRQRWVDHRKKIRKETHANPHMQSAWVMYGEESFRFEVVQVELDLTKLPDLEQHYINNLRAQDPDHGYNMSSGGLVNYIRSPESRARMSAAQKGNTRMTPEVRAKMSASKMGQGKGRVKSPEEIEHLRQAHARRAADPEGYTFHRSPEWLSKISTARKGVPWTPARWEAHLKQAKVPCRTKGSHRTTSVVKRTPMTEDAKAKLSAARKGVPRPPEVGAKVSAALKGRPWTPERKEAARVRAAQRKGD